MCCSVVAFVVVVVVIANLNKPYLVLIVMHLKMHFIWNLEKSIWLPHISFVSTSLYFNLKSKFSVSDFFICAAIAIQSYFNYIHCSILFVWHNGALLTLSSYYLGEISQIFLTICSVGGQNIITASHIGLLPFNKRKRFHTFDRLRMISQRLKKQSIVFWRWETSLYRVKSVVQSVRFKIFLKNKGNEVS